MSKPLPTQTVFAGLAPPWSLTNLDSNFASIAAAIADIGTYSNTLIDTGAVNAMVGTFPAGITFSIAQGVSVYVLAANTTTSTTVTLNVNSTGSKPVLLSNGLVPPVGALVAGGIYAFAYDGTNWRLLNPSVSNLSAATKVNTTTRTSTATPANDPDLQVAIPGSGIYSIQLYVVFTLATNSQGFLMNLNFSGTLTGNSTYSGGGGAPASALTTSQGTTGGPAVVSNTAQTGVITLSGNLQATSAGTLAIAWSQWISNANNVSLNGGSWLQAFKIQ